MEGEQHPISHNLRAESGDHQSEWVPVHSLALRLALVKYWTPFASTQSAAGAGAWLHLPSILATSGDLEYIFDILI